LGKAISFLGLATQGGDFVALLGRSERDDDDGNQESG
jgi:hypothetical protein